MNKLWGTEMLQINKASEIRLYLNFCFCSVCLKYARYGADITETLG